MPEPARVVARFVDGRILKGYTMNFDPSRAAFTLRLVGDAPGAEPTAIQLRELKAVFFVKDFDGVPEYSERKDFTTAPAGRKLTVRFADGEVLVGASMAYDPARAGFFLFPADKFSNNDKVFVIAAAVAEVARIQS